MPVSSTTPGPSGARAGAPVGFAFHCGDSVGARDKFSIAAQWLACTFPYRRFADTLADDCARLGADVARYTFIAVDLHHLLLTGLPAHLRRNSIRPAFVIEAVPYGTVGFNQASPRGANRPARISRARAHPASTDVGIRASGRTRILREDRVQRDPVRCADDHRCNEQPTREGSSGGAPPTSESSSPGTQAG